MATKAFCQWKQFFASDGQEKELHPLEEKKFQIFYLKKISDFFFCIHLKIYSPFDPNKIFLLHRAKRNHKARFSSFKKQHFKPQINFSTAATNLNASNMFQAEAHQQQQLQRSSNVVTQQQGGLIIML